MNNAINSNKQLALEQTKVSNDTQRTRIDADQNARQAALAPFQLLEANINSKNAEIAQASRIDLQKKLDTALAMNGLTPLTVDQFRALPDAKMKSFIADQIMDPNLQQGQYGYNATDAVRRVNAAEVPLPAGIDYVRNKLTNFMQSAITAVGPQVFKTLPLEDQNAKIQTSIQTSVQAERNNIPNEGGIFSPAPLSSTVKIPAVFATDIGKALMPLANGNPNYATKSQDVFATAALLIQQGKLTVGQASDQISQIYNAIAADVSNQRQYQRFHIAGPSAETGFRQTVLTGGFNSSTTIDMTKPGAVATTLQRMIYNQGAGAGGVQGAGVGP